MSAPLVVNTTDGTCWTQRKATRDGEPLYALADCVRCPELVMATYAELAEHGIAGSTDALPVPMGPEPSERDQLRAALIEALDNAHQTHPCPATGRPYWTSCVHFDEAGRMDHAATGSCHSERRADAVLAVRDVELERLQARVAELEAERHSTNEALDDAVQELRARGDEPAAKCRCDEPDADPYACEADDCTHEFSELNPFGASARPVNVASAEVSETCGCGWRTSVWHVDDGSAEEELHGHVARVHGGIYPQKAGA